MQQDANSVVMEKRRQVLFWAIGRAIEIAEEQLAEQNKAGTDATRKLQSVPASSELLEGTRGPTP
jgi:hypothetical protein